MAESNRIFFRRGRALRIEHLEERRLLSVSVDIVSRIADTSIAAGGTSHYFETPQYAVSANGRYVAFVSNAENIVGGVTLTPGTDNIYRFDRQTGEVLLVSSDPMGAHGANSNAVMPQISADGNVIAFISFASNLHPLDTNKNDDIFVRNMTTGATQLVSLNQSGTASGNGRSAAPSLSADGSVIAFVSQANNLHPLDRDKNWDIYARNLETGFLQLVSINAAGTGPSNDSDYGISAPVLSANGRVIAFYSEATDLHPLDTDTASDVYARDLVSGITELVSVNFAGTGSGNNGGNDRSWNPVISADGQMIAFVSLARGLHPLDTEPGADSHADVFARDLAGGITHLVSVNSAGTNSGDGASVSPSISADGKVISFESSAVDLTKHTIESIQVYARNLANGTTQLVSVDTTGIGGADSFSWYSEISADGRIVVFASDASNLHALDIDDSSMVDLDIYAHDLATGVTHLLSVNRQCDGAGNQESRWPVVSADGSVVAFSSDATDLIADDNNQRHDVFVATIDWAASLLPGDYNHDHVVDSADYSQWRDALGQSGLSPFSGADGDGDGTVDQDDYLVWKAHFGERRLSVGSGAVDVANSVGVAAETGEQPLQTESTSSVRRRAWIGNLPAGATSTAHEKPQFHNRSMDRNTARRSDAGLMAWLAMRHVRSAEHLPVREPIAAAYERVFDARQAELSDLVLSALLR